jgi:hypothetical protein
MNNARLVYLGPVRTTLTLTIVGFLVSIPVVGIMEFFRQYDTRPTRHAGIEWSTDLLIVILFTLFSFVVSFVGALAFNAVSRLTGGVPYRAKQVESLAETLPGDQSNA